MSVDAYAHCGREKYLPVEALDAVMNAAEVSSAVLCQHLGQFDNSYIASLIEREPARFAGVALVDHESQSWDDQIESVVAQGFHGVRITDTALRENPRVVAAAASAGLVVVVYAPNGVGSLVHQLLELAAAHTRARIVVSHLGNPTVTDGRVQRGDEVLSLADAPNVYVVLSGLDMFCPFPYSQLDALITAVVETFGPERVMWGSNYPVCGDETDDYGRLLELVRVGTQWGIGPSAVEAITDSPARRVWFA